MLNKNLNYINVKDTKKYEKNKRKFLSLIFKQGTRQYYVIQKQKHKNYK